jgi:hypothetical protein
MGVVVLQSPAGEREKSIMDLEAATASCSVSDAGILEEEVVKCNGRAAVAKMEKQPFGVNCWHT